MNDKGNDTDNRKPLEQGWNKQPSGLILPDTDTPSALKKLHQHRIHRHNSIRFWLDFLRDNVSLIVLIPTFFGASWQIIALARLNLSYIRFFSVSQVPVDGALLIFIALLGFVFYKIYLRFTGSDLATIKKRAKAFANDYDQSLKRYFFRALIKFTLLLIAIIALIVLSIDYLSNQSPVLIILTLIAGFIVLVNKALIFIIKSGYLIDTSQRLKTRGQAQGGHLFLDAYLMFLALSGLIFIFGLITYLNDRLLIPYNLKNVEQIQSVVHEDYGSERFQIKYLNDNYIFIQLCGSKPCHDGNDIVIYKTADILFAKKAQLTK